MSIFKDASVSRTTFPATEHITKSQIEGACCKNILRNASLSIPVARSIFTWDECLNMCAVDSAQTSFEEWEELGIILNLRWHPAHTRYLVFGPACEDGRSNSGYIEERHVCLDFREPFVPSIVEVQVLATRKSCVVLTGEVSLDLLLDG